MPLTDAYLAAVARSHRGLVAQINGHSDGKNNLQQGATQARKRLRTLLVEPSFKGG